MTDNRPTAILANTPNWLDEATKLKGIVVARLESMPEPQRVAAPKPGEWSAAGVVEHLILLEETLAGQWRQRQLEKGSPKAGFKSLVLSRMVGSVLSKTGIRVPSLPELEPHEPMSLDALRDRWETARERMITSLPDDPRTAWVMHPVFGPLSSDQMGGMLVAHLRHHLRHWPMVKG